MYYGAAADASLVTAVETLAFAGVRNVYEVGMSFATKARLRYAASLRHIQRAIGDHDVMKTDAMLLSVLLLDQFEVSAKRVYRLHNQSGRAPR
jgi:hypothetical protein